MDKLELLNELETLLETRQKYCWSRAEDSYPNVVNLINELKSAQQSVAAELLPDENLDGDYRLPGDVLDIVD